jgi:tetratricopeptide (TPR) repeat protein
VASFLSGLVGVLVATNQPAAVSNLVLEKTGAKIEIADPNDPVEREYLGLLDLDNSAQSEVERWLADNEKLAAAGAGDAEATLRLRVRQRFESVEKAYQDFLQRHPKHFKAHMAYGSFLGDIGREDDGAQEYIKAREMNPKDPAPWNNLANYYGHVSPVTNAFACYEKAIELNPNEAIYFQNFATTVYLFRSDATNYYKISVQQVFDKAMGLYRKALALDPANFPLATDLAQTYYGIQPPRAKDAFQAWNNALKIARDDLEREGIHIHLARWHRTTGDVEAAKRELNLVTNANYTAVKKSILKSLEKRESTNNSALPQLENSGGNR